MNLESWFSCLHFKFDQVWGSITVISSLYFSTSKFLLNGPERAVWGLWEDIRYAIQATKVAEIMGLIQVPPHEH